MNEKEQASNPRGSESKASNETHIFWLLCAFLARLGSSPGHPGLGGQISCFDGLSQTRGFAIQFPIKLFNLEPPGSKCTSEGSGPLSR